MKTERLFACLLKADRSTNYIYVYSLHYWLMISSLSDLNRGEQLRVKRLPQVVEEPYPLIHHFPDNI